MSDLQAQLEEAGNMITVPASWGTFDEFHAKLALLRKHDPVHLVNAPDHYPFWLLTKNADIFEIEAKSNIFLNEPRPILANVEADDHTRNNGNMLRTLIHMDEPDHAEYRKVAADWFLPKNLARLDARMSELAKQSVDKMSDLGGKCDFSRDIALQYPLQVILAILGLPETDYQRMLMLTQEMFGNADPDLQRGTTIEDLTQVINDFFIYFSELSASRKSTPTHDLASTIANGEVYDKPLGDVEMISYYIITATAGHDTTSAAIAGGMLSLLQNPDQLKRLQDDMSLLPTAVDEMIRWVSPVTHFMRTATEDYTIRNTTIKAGESVLLSYPSGNRDEDTFTDPFKFDVGRTPNRHLAFGFGIHYCLGAMLARMEMRTFFNELIPRIKTMELAGDYAHIHTTFVGGLKRLPVTYSLK
jgi:cytochrome P450